MMGYHMTRQRLIRMWGLRPGSDIEIVETSLRPGEKLHEELWWATENAAPSRHPKIMLATVGGALRSVVGLIPIIRELVDQGEGAEIVPVRDPAATAAAIVRLLQDPELRAVHGARNRSVVVERAGAAGETQKCLALYGRLCGVSE